MARVEEDEGLGLRQFRTANTCRAMGADCRGHPRASGTTPKRIVSRRDAKRPCVPEDVRYLLLAEFGAGRSRPRGRRGYFRTNALYPRLLIYTVYGKPSCSEPT